MLPESNRDLPSSAFGRARPDVTVWSSRRPRPTIDLYPEEPASSRFGRWWPYAAALSLAMIAGAAAATFATAPALTDGVDEVSGISAVEARSMGLALNIDPTGERARDAALGRDVGALKSEISRLNRALGQAKANQAALSKTAAGQAAAGQEDVKALKAEVVALQKDLAATREAASAKIVELTAKVEQPPKPADDAQRFSELKERLDKIENRETAAASKPKPVDDPETTGSVAPDAGGSVVRNWTVREVYDGLALVEGRQGSYEVGRGDAIPGVGRVRSIERRDRQWVVVTDRGVILQRP